MGSDAHLKDAIRRLVDLGTKTALITMGAKGAILSDGKSFWHIVSPKVPTANPIGSGDSVSAGYAAGLVDGDAPLLPQVLRPRQLGRVLEGRGGQEETLFVGPELHARQLRCRVTREGVADGCGHASGSHLQMSSLLLRCALA